MSVPGGSTGCKTPVLEKTRICYHHLQGKCRLGDACGFAHDKMELRQNPDLRFTSLCFSVAKGTECRRGAECTYAHSLEEVEEARTRLRNHNHILQQQQQQAKFSYQQQQHEVQREQVVEVCCSPDTEAPPSLEGSDFSGPCVTQGGSWETGTSLPPPGRGGSRGSQMTMNSGTPSSSSRPPVYPHTHRSGSGRAEKHWPPSNGLGDRRTRPPPFTSYAPNVSPLQALGDDWKKLVGPPITVPKGMSMEAGSVEFFNFICQQFGFEELPTTSTTHTMGGGSGEGQMLWGSPPATGLSSSVPQQPKGNGGSPPLPSLWKRGARGPESNAPKGVERGGASLVLSG
uniref:C3H1-type domain-containing protein n=1 Tax=Chromera velia CCMP2878 TaxID=1169474 RepID=A0A0G4HBJ6_9ALVE|eukprot:Cvel_25869.t1-p1 / transcript=Cvel_25869.t1 / gene=Cvel_25869 / organism=Chromera_velia_CCMP2878 / gene_product=hypothetical protein / transcript_product=hypothetical protein / location=Cvel_scaffold2985:2560-5414(+) / protein_length=342 / sequence_SO=supercontig / SO=protein_coding / is_pseudo=false